MKLRSFLLRTAFLMLLISNVSKAQITPANNFIVLDISTFPQSAAFNYDSCFALGDNLGVNSVGLSQNWTAIETSPGVFNMTIFDIANYYYPAHSMPVDLTVTPIHTNNLEVPSDLTSTNFDDPAFISRFNILLDSIKMHSPNLVLSSLVIGSEHDVYLGSNATKWAQYTTFYNSVMTHARTLWPGIKIATELTYTGITTFNVFAQNMNINSDYIGVSYYPLNPDFTVQSPTVVPTNLATIVGLYPVKPICFYQYGYPSSPTCNSSEALQSQFITETFNAWDTYATNIKMIDFTWLHDLDTALVNYYGTYYGITNPAFLEFLHTLGLRNWNGSGSDKAAFLELECQAKQRGYNALNIACTTGINEQESENTPFVYPNPAQNNVRIEINSKLQEPELFIYNSLGQELKHIRIQGSAFINMETNDLQNGIYFISLQDKHNKFNNKLIISK